MATPDPQRSASDPKLMDRIVNLAKRRGLVFPSSEIYGGFRSTWDYGPLGVLLKRNVKDAWWRSMVQLRDDVAGLDAAILMAPKVWEASGHVATFTDPLVDCRNCNERFRADHLPASGACPNCGAKNSFTEARQFNLMFKTYVGPVEDDSAVAYLRPETAQGIFVNFKNVVTTTRRKPPFGIAQIGKSFRNEITPGNFIFRTREFEQMEMEYFVPPEDGDRWYEYWVQQRFSWFVDLGVPESMLRIRPHDADELSHYSTSTSDIEFAFPWGWGELEGIANRTDYDLSQHAKFSGEDLTYFDQERDRHYLPYVIEPALGADRATLVFLLSAYHEEEVKGEKRTVLRLHPRLAPTKVAVLPLSRNERLSPLAGDIAGALRRHFQIDVDDAGSIGRRYRRQDEVGTPLCVTVDFESLDDQAVTVRDRDTMEQERIGIDRLVDVLRTRLNL
jgi:glycyl-tRNA synthetase